MIIRNHSIAIVEELPLEKWSPVRIPIAKGSGFIFLVLRRRICLRNGIVWIVRNRGIKRGIQFQGGILLIRKMLMLDLHSK